MTTLQEYMDRAAGALQKFGILRQEENELVSLLNEVQDVDPDRVAVIAQTVTYIESFNQLVRDNVTETSIATRYSDIAESFNSIREDAQRLLDIAEDGKVDSRERLGLFWMRLTRGKLTSRFDRIDDVYTNVREDAREVLHREDSILDAYQDFRFALGKTTVIAREVLVEQEEIYEAAIAALESAQADLDNYKTGKDEGYDFTTDSAFRELEIARDEASRNHKEQDRRYQLLKDTSELMDVGYNAGDTLIMRLQQAHDVRDQVYRRGATFWNTNSHVFSIMSAVYQSTLGLDEDARALEEMARGTNEGLEQLAGMGNTVMMRALEAGYGKVIDPESIKALVDSIVQYQEDSIRLIQDLRQEATQATQEISAVYDNGRRRIVNAVTSYQESSS